MYSSNCNTNSAGYNLSPAYSKQHQGFLWSISCHARSILAYLAESCLHLPASCIRSSSCSVPCGLICSVHVQSIWDSCAILIGIFHNLRACLFTFASEPSCAAMVDFCRWSFWFFLFPATVLKLHLYWLFGCKRLNSGHWIFQNWSGTSLPILFVNADLDQ